MNDRVYLALLLPSFISLGIYMAVMIFPLCKTMIHPSDSIRTNLRKGFNLVSRNIAPVLTLSAGFTVLQILWAGLVGSVAAYTQGITWMTTGSALTTITATPIYYTLTLAGSLFLYPFAITTMVLLYLDLTKKP